MAPAAFGRVRVVRSAAAEPGVAVRVVRRQPAGRHAVVVRRTARMNAHALAILELDRALDAVAGRAASSLGLSFSATL